MKKSFSVYNKRTIDEINQIWSNCIFTLDANVLLNLYRYSPSTRDAMINLLYQFSDRIWLSHQACFEYYVHRYEVISELEKSYRNFLISIDEIQKEIANKSKPPFFSSSLGFEIDNVFKKMKTEINEKLIDISSYYNEDTIGDELDKIIKNNIGTEYSQKEKEAILKEGKERYAKSIPPGYQDNNKTDNEKRYGDLIMWYQIIDESKKKKKDIVLITDERKQDWIWKLKDGKSMGPRPELIAEIREKANQDILLYSTEMFIKFGAEYSNQEVNDLVLKELKEFRKEQEKKDVELRGEFSHLEQMEKVVKEKKREEIEAKILQIKTRRKEVIDLIEALSLKEQITEDERRTRRELVVEKEALLRQLMAMSEEHDKLRDTVFQKLIEFISS